MAVKAAKAALRKDMKKRLASITTEERERQSSLIATKLTESNVYKSSRRVCVYLSLPEEVQTGTLLQHILSSGKACFIPRYSHGDGSRSMEMVRLHSMLDYESLPMTKWNIRQPPLDEDREEALEGGLDLVIVPGLAFTACGKRLGRGKGYYDTYLEKLLTRGRGQIPVTVALAYTQQVLDDLPTSDNDRDIDMVITA